MRGLGAPSQIVIAVLSQGCDGDGEGAPRMFNVMMWTKEGGEIMTLSDLSSTPCELIQEAKSMYACRL